MKPAPIPEDEKSRLAILRSLEILDTKPEERFDKITREAVEKLHVPISTISLIDSNREWYKSHQGIDKPEGPRKISFCGHALLANYVFIVEDTLKDERFKDNPAVIGFPFVRFYAGVALNDKKTGKPLGVFCVKDTKPRKLSVEEVSILMDLGMRAEKELNRKA